MVLTTNSLTIAEHKNLKTILLSPPLDGALYPLRPPCRERRIQRACMSVGSDAGYDPQIAYGTTPQCLEGLLIARAIVYSDRMLN